MNSLMKNLFAVTAVALLLSIAMANMSQTCNKINAEVIYQEADPNDPDPLPEMVPADFQLNVIGEDANEPDPLPEMVPAGLRLDVIEEDPNEPDPLPEMVPAGLWLNAIGEDANEPDPLPEMVPFI